jgi:hypothetical protein
MPYPSNRPFSEIRVGAFSPSIGATPVAAYTGAPCRGEIVKAGVVLNGTLTGGPLVVDVQVNGVSVGGAGASFTTVVGPAGTIGTFAPSSPNNVNEDDIISFIPSGATGATIGGAFLCRAARSGDITNGCATCNYRQLQPIN